MIIEPAKQHCLINEVIILSSNTNTNIHQHFQRSSNPIFLRTTVFRESDGVDERQTEIKIAAYDLRERFTSTSTLLGTSTVFMDELKKAGKQTICAVT